MTTSAAELLAARGCSAQCLTARDASSSCGCRCASRYHGALASAVLSEPTNGSTTLASTDALSAATNCPAA